jgi:7,8-dihydroneopterin aldolase/epimerase/oxygenase
MAAASDYRIVIRNLVLAARIGIHPHEKARPPRLRITVELAMADLPPQRDELGEVMDYERIVAGVRALAVERHIHLVETFAEGVARLCLADRKVAGVRVSVEKLDVYSDAESVGVILERRR